MDMLKIDRSFVEELGGDTKDASLADVIVQLGDVLQLQTVAEGVEETAQHECLRALGCDTAQGFLFARPMAPEDLVATPCSIRGWSAFSESNHGRAGSDCERGRIGLENHSGASRGQSLAARPVDYSPPPDETVGQA